MTNEVIIQPTGRRLSVEDEESVLDAALRAGLNLSHSCKGGNCAACRARLLAGRVHYPEGRPAGLSAEEESQGFVLLCRARPLEALTVEALEVRRSEEIKVKRLPCRVEKMSKLCHDVMALYLRLPAVEPLSFLAGQYIDVLLPGGGRRSFSIASPPSEPLLEIHARRVPGGDFTGRVFGEMKEKALLQIEGPLGAFYLRDTQRPVLFVAGGTGYAPVKSILTEMYAGDEDRSVHFYWGARAYRDLYDLERVCAWSEAISGFGFTPVLSEPFAEDRWPGRAGLVHAAVLQDHTDLSGFDVYAAGPPQMVEAARREFLARGLPASAFFFDSFDYAARG